MKKIILLVAETLSKREHVSKIMGNLAVRGKERRNPQK
jgi:hypothetical protein